MSYQKEDVYETEDLPEDDQQMIEDDFTESEVERVHIDVDNAMKRFKGRLLSAENVDFSDSVARRKRYGYGGGSYVLEVVGPYADETETLEQKFTRLKLEVEGLVEAMQIKKELEKPNTSFVAEEDLLAILETLKAMQIRRDNASLYFHNLEKDCNDPESNAAVAIKDNVVNGRLVALENRISCLEQMVNGPGGSEECEKTTKVPIAEAVEDLRMRVQLLHPAHVDGLHSRMTQILSKFQQIDEKKKEKSDSEFEEKVNKLYEMMNRWDTTCTGLSSAVKRMHDLRMLHEQAEQFGAKLSLLTGIRAQLIKTVEREEMMLFDFRQQTHSAIEKLCTNIENLEERINKLNA
ncbi:unnamed protein product [Thelazia callipaeda]|uniref:Dynactin subunit 2 n=1 Tax=Thelazia callipaeda TaxID=103827 RepID=A0A0N5D2Y3_THECL|nr:unnamed protein product [Thelazia callipaeda]